MFFYIIGFFVEQPPVYFTNIPFPVEDVNLNPGGEFAFTVSRCNDYDKAVTYEFTQVLRNIETGYEYVLPGGISTAPPGCNEIHSIPKEIPDYVRNGTYILRFDLNIPGFFREHHVSIQTESFVIGKK